MRLHQQGLPALQLQGVQRGAATEFPAHHLSLRARFGQHDLFRANAEGHGPRARCAEFHGAQWRLGHLAGRHAGKQIAAPQKIGDEGGTRVKVQVLGGGHLLDLSRAHDGHAVTEGQGFFLVVRDQNRGHAGQAQQSPEILASGVAQPGVQVGKGFVQEEQGGTGGQRAGQRDPLLLPPGELMGSATFEHGEAHQGQGFAGAGEPLRAGQVGQAERDVLQHAQVREQRVVLKHQPHAPLLRGQAAHVASCDQDRTGVGRVQASDQAEGRGFAAPAGPEEREQFAPVQVEIQAVHDRGEGRLEAPGQAPQAQRQGFRFGGSHGWSSRRRISRVSRTPLRSSTRAAGAAWAYCASSV